MESCKVATMNEWGERRSKQTRWFDGSTSLRITAGGGGAAEVQVTVLLKGFVQSNRWQISKAFSVEYQFRRFIGCVQYTAVLCLHQDWTQDHGPSFWRCHSEPGPVCSILEPRHSSSHPKKEKTMTNVMYNKIKLTGQAYWQAPNKWMCFHRQHAAAGLQKLEQTLYTTTSVV